MQNFNTIDEFNTYLSKSLIKYDLNVYFNYIHSKFYNNIDISFMDYFLSLIEHRGEFCVEHTKLKEYGIIENIENTNNILKSLIGHGLIENADYHVRNVSQVRKTLNGLNRGEVIKNHYKLTPYAFKLCLIRAKNSKKYANYYLLLEECFYYYKDYQNKYQVQLISMKDDKIDRLLQENKEQTAKIDDLLKFANYTKTSLDETSSKLDETLEQNGDLKSSVENLNNNIGDLNENITDLNSDINDLNNDIGDMKEKIDDIKSNFKETANRSVPDPKESNKKSEFILLQHKEHLNIFKFIRGIQVYNDKKIKKYEEEYNIIKREYDANPIQLYSRFKETIKEEYVLEKLIIKENKKLKNKRQLYKELEKIKFIRNTFTTNNLSLDELLNKIDQVYNDKFTSYEETE